MQVNKPLTCLSDSNVEENMGLVSLPRLPCYGLPRRMCICKIAVITALNINFEKRANSKLAFTSMSKRIFVETIYSHENVLLQQVLFIKFKLIFIKVFARGLLLKNGHNVPRKWSSAFIRFEIRRKNLAFFTFLYYTKID